MAWSESGTRFSTSVVCDSSASQSEGGTCSVTRLLRP